MAHFVRRNFKGKEIIEIDFTHCNEREMIRLVDELRAQIIDDQRQVAILAIFNEKNHLTPTFMKYFAENRREEVAPLLRKQAVVGLSQPKKSTVKAFNIVFDRNIRVFESRTEAMKYLVSEDTDG